MRRRWRDYRTARGGRPVKAFLDALSYEDRANVLVAMRAVAATGMSAARHVHAEIYEVRADGDRQTFRILFAPEGRRQVLLALDAFSKKTQKTPPKSLALAKRRLADWRSRGHHV